MKKTISLKLPAELESQLARLSRQRSVTRSEIVRAALEAYLATGTAAPRSCLDLAGDLPGSLEGPADLASNPRHLKGYGR
jgi:hypothetical protein